MITTDITLRPAAVRVTYTTDQTEYLTAWFEWEGVDRKVSQGISLSLDRHLARLTRAFLDGKLFPDAHIATDIHGQTYAAGTCQVYSRTASADLTRLGY